MSKYNHKERMEAIYARRGRTRSVPTAQYLYMPVVNNSKAGVAYLNTKRVLCDMQGRPIPKFENQKYDR